jgi:hypothetical protein
MDQVTQQNAALVEEVAAAAESMDHQAQGLGQAVAIFKLAAEPHARAHEPSQSSEADEPREESAATKVATDVLTHGLDRHALRA